MFNVKQIRTVFTFYFKIIIKSRKTKLFFLLSIVPALIILLVTVLNRGNARLNSSFLFYNIGMQFLFGLYIQILTLVFATSIINDEVSNKTLTYLTTRPLSRTDILIGKLIATLSSTMIIMMFAIISAFLALLNLGVFKDIGLISIFGTALLMLFAYTSFFMLLGIGFKRPVIIGLLLVFGYEPVAILIGGTMKKFSFAYYMNGLLPKEIYSYSLTHSPAFQSILTMVFAGLFFVIISTILFNKKEFLL